jgi:hypothetical protein
MIRISSPPSMRALAVSQNRQCEEAGIGPPLIPSDQPDQGHEAEHDAGCNQGDGPPARSCRRPPGEDLAHGDVAQLRPPPGNVGRDLAR